MVAVPPAAVVDVDDLLVRMLPPLGLATGEEQYALLRLPVPSLCRPLVGLSTVAVALGTVAVGLSAVAVGLGAVAVGLGI